MTLQLGTKVQFTRNWRHKWGLNVPKGTTGQVSHILPNGNVCVTPNDVEGWEAGEGVMFLNETEALKFVRILTGN